MEQQGLKLLSFSVTDYILVLIPWHSNPPSDEKVLMFLYMVIFSVQSTLQESWDVLKHLSNHTTLKRLSGTDKMTPLRKTQAIHLTGVYTKQITFKTVVRKEREDAACPVLCSSCHSQQMCCNCVVLCHSLLKFQLLAKLLLAKVLKQNSSLKALYEIIT